MTSNPDGGDAPVWVAAVGYSQFTASLVFAGGLNRELHQKTAYLSVGRMLGGLWQLRVSAARIGGGDIAGAASTATVEPGWSFAVQTSRRFRVDSLPSLYVSGSAALATSFASARYGKGDGATSLTAGDMRLGAVVGWVLLERFVPYAAVRVFGGPVNWRAEKDGADVAGTDRKHFQVGAGMSARLPANLYASAEYVPLGEQSLSAELGMRF